MSNGEKREFKDKLLLAMKLILSRDIMAEVARDLEREELERQSRRDTTKQHEQAEADNGECLNHS